MKLSFESNLSYQQEAIQSVVGLFEGQNVEDSGYSYNLTGALNKIDGIANKLVLTEEQVLRNLQDVQEQNELPKSQTLEGMHFSVEMETGTGKTYFFG